MSDERPALLSEAPKVARKRMLDPEFWKDLHIRNLSFIERLFFLGCISAADDEGRLIGDPAHLRSEIFRYDEITTEDVEEIRDHVAEVVPGFVVYQDDGESYIAFRNWATYQKPSYAKPSTYPEPPFVRDSSEKDEEGARPATEIRPQYSIGKDSIDKSKSLSESVTKGEQQHKRKNPDTPHHRVVDGYVKRISKGYSKRFPGEFAGDMKAIKHLLERGHSEETIFRYYDEQKAGWWSTQHLSMRTVDKNIDDWVKSGGRRGTHKQPDDDPLGFNAAAKRRQAEGR